jgi:hypothetical protein
MQVMNSVLEGTELLPALLMCLPKQSAAILRHARPDPSCKLCSSSEDSNRDTEAAAAVLQAFNSMAAAASYAQLHAGAAAALAAAGCQQTSG